ncbi:glycosyl hydrolase family 65 protein [Streptoalloteichus hindustanus]|uniref:Kojibiose phosphorylase n=1 Tax=Streptoalloteichus hindustanus TaxID=2017 RepID=Q2MEY2_STRHI|nr:glycosyl hydrolase family 65 protein [Streptoalloteichus hindustanus]CAI47642.1 putative phosphorylase or hydrolase [Streptoalloteichus hindustanus]SHG39233.1 kojibiose phosphorylase [Streptoalloteichus hindustanus]
MTSTASDPNRGPGGQADPGWVIERTAYRRTEDSFYESLFALSNGRIGVRATADFDAGGGWPGFYHARMYARAVTVRRHLVNAPTPAFRAVLVDGVPLAVTADRVTEFRQRLDLRRARQELVVTVRDGQGRHTRIETTTLLPAQFTTTLVQRVAVTPLDHDAPVTVLTGVDWSTGNGDLGGQLPRVRVHHAEPLDLGYRPGRLDARVRSFGHEEEITERLAVLAASAEPEARDVCFGRVRHAEALRFAGGAGREIRVDTVAVISTNFDDDAVSVDPDVDAVPDIDLVVAEHERIWAERWRRHAEVEGDPAIVQGMRYSQFHLFGSIDRGRTVHNVPARGLSSEYHSGHFFYNTEFFALPHAAWTDPAAAKAMLRFRVATLDAAREHARRTGYEGARFPEEADLLGESGSAHLVRDVLRDDEWEERAGAQVVHTSADVLHGLRSYVEITGDRDVLREECVPLLVETARYLACLLRFDPEVGGRTVRGIMGFDEYHYDVDHDFGTNALVSWGLSWAAETLRELAGHHSEVRAALRERGIGEDVLQEWAVAAREVYLPPARDGVRPLFAGYFELPDELCSVEPGHNLPGPVKENDERRLSGLVKQADVVQTMVLLSERFTREEIERNLRYYEPRTAHGSSLSPMTHAIAAAWAGDLPLATRLLAGTARYNLDFAPRDNFRNGIHLGAGAGAWLVLVRGFLGADASGEVLRFAPRLPEGVTALRVPLRWRGRGLTVALTADGLELVADGDNPLTLPVEVDGRRAELAPGGRRVFAPAPSGAVLTG